MTVPSRRPDADRRALLDSPWIAAAIAAVVLGVAAALVVPGVLGPFQPGASGSPSGPAVPTAAPTIPGPTFVRPTPSPPPAFTTHVVKAGDTLSSIARTYDTTARSIAWWNRGTHPTLDPESEAYDPDRLTVGWALVLIPGAEVDDANPPAPIMTQEPASTPGTNPAPGPVTTALPWQTPGPGPSSAPQVTTVIHHGPRSVPTIALTFDMGGRLEPAVDIVRWLIDHDVHATLFPTGRSGTQTVQGLAAMQLAATRPDLFDFANHSWDHPDFRTLTASQMAEQLLGTEAALTPIVGSTRPWFRPPFGGLDEAVRAGVGAAGWSRIVMWDVDMIDWRPEAEGGPTAASMEAKLRANARGGSIVLLHLGGWNTLAALPGLLDAAADLGLEPVTLGEMLGG